MRTEQADHQPLATHPSVAFVELNPGTPCIGEFLICPSYGLLVLATGLRERGCDVAVYVEGLENIALDSLTTYDFVCLTVKSPSANKTYRLADQLRERGTTVILGGTHATLYTRDCLKHCDYVIRGEADEALPQLIDKLWRGHDQALPDGVSYTAGDSAEISGFARAPTADGLVTAVDYSLIRGISKCNLRWCLRNRRLLQLPVQTSRGCPHHCSFCVTDQMFGNRYRKRPIDAVIEEMRNARRFTNRVMLVDNNLIGTSKHDLSHTRELLMRVAKEKLGLRALAFVTLDIGEKHEEFRQLLRSAGVATLIIGFESLSRKSQDQYRKRQEIQSMERTILELKEFGFTIAGTFMAGADGDDAWNVIDTASWVSNWRLDQFFYFAFSPYPFTREIVGPERFFLQDWDHATGHHIYFFPRSERPSNLQRAICRSTFSFYSYMRIARALLTLRFRKAISLWVRRVLFSRIQKPIMRDYVPLLEDIERGLYDEGGHLMDCNLGEQVPGCIVSRSMFEDDISRRQQETSPQGKKYDEYAWNGEHVGM